MPRAVSRSEVVPVRGIPYHLRHWGEPGAPLMVALHGWMDVSASFQFLADHLAGQWHIVAPDWRGFGLTGPTGDDCYEFTDYLGDLDAILRHLAPSTPTVVVGHSMGGNAAMLYAGARPSAVGALVNLEGLGMPGIAAHQVPERLGSWLDQLAAPPRLKTYASLEEVSRRLQHANPKLPSDKALFLAEHWAARGDDGRWSLRADPAHKIINRVAYRVDEVQACWRAIDAPVLWVEAEHSDVLGRMRALPDYEQRLRAIRRLSRARVADAGHMLHHDQPAAVAQLVADFLETCGC